MKLAQVALLDEQGRNVWFGSLRGFFRANDMGREERADIIAQLRPCEDRPSAACIGGGAAPVFYVSVVA